MKLYLIIFVFLITSLTGFAQPDNPPGDPGDPPTVPITGIELLIAAGGLFGAKKIYDKRRKS